jgi:hypothetical protein
MELTETGLRSLSFLCVGRQHRQNHRSMLTPPLQGHARAELRDHFGRIFRANSGAYQEATEDGLAGSLDLAC